jgi:hypothetical protein
LWPTFSSLLTHRYLTFCTWDALSFLIMLRPAARQHLLQEAFPEPLPFAGGHKHTVLRLGLPRGRIKPFSSSVSPALGALRVDALSGLGSIPPPLPQCGDPHSHHVMISKAPGG